MGTIPSNPSFTPGQKLTAAQLSSMTAVTDFWANPPRCSVYQNTVTSFTSGTYAVVLFDAELFDIVQSGDSEMHSTSTNTSRITIRTTGKYEVAAQLAFAANSTGNRLLQIRQNAGGVQTNGTLLLQSGVTPSVGTTTYVSPPPVEHQLAAGDHVELFGLQTSGGALNSVTSLGLTFLRVRLVAS